MVFSKVAVIFLFEAKSVHLTDWSLRKLKKKKLKEQKNNKSEISNYRWKGATSGDMLSLLVVYEYYMESVKIILSVIRTRGKTFVGSSKICQNVNENLVP